MSLAISARCKLEGFCYKGLCMCQGFEIRVKDRLPITVFLVDITDMRIKSKEKDELVASTSSQSDFFASLRTQALLSEVLRQSLFRDVRSASTAGDFQRKYPIHMFFTHIFHAKTT